MDLGHTQPPLPRNEPVLGYATGSPERAALLSELARVKAEPVEVPVIVAGERVRSGVTAPLRAPCDHGLELGRFHCTGPA